MARPASLTIVEECIAEVPPDDALLPNLATLGTVDLLLWWHVPPAHGRDLLVRLRLSSPYDSAAGWEALTRAPRGLVGVYEATGHRGAVRALAGLLVTWRLLGDEIIRRFDRAPIGCTYAHLEEFGPRALDAIVRRLHARRLRGEYDDPRPGRQIEDGRARGLADLVAAHGEAKASVPTVPPLDACPFRIAGPAPAGWEDANQWRMAEDQRKTLAEHYAVLAGLLDKGATPGRGPYVVRTAHSTTARELAAQRRGGAGETWVCRDWTRRDGTDNGRPCGEHVRWTKRECPRCGGLRPTGPEVAVEATPDDPLTHLLDAERERRTQTAYLDALKRPEAAAIIKALESADHNVTRAARQLGMSRKTFYKRLAKLPPAGPLD